MLEIGDKKVIVIGAGPAGLTAAYELSKANIRSIVLEKDSIVGGISRTVNYKGYHFDIGGHRFFTKVKAVNDMWHNVLPDGDFLRRKRLSRIYYNKRFFYYPLRVSNALLGLGPWNSLLILVSYLWAQTFPGKSEETFEQWVSNRFGKRLYEVFFKTYTEKVWGMPCSEISAEWAAQRIKGLSLLTALKNALIKQHTHKGDVIKTLIDAFDYPKQGPGMMWETVADIIQKMGNQLQLETEVERIFWTNSRVDAVEIQKNGQKELIGGTHFISSMPIRELIQTFEPAVPLNILRAAKELKYRDFLTVALIIKKHNVFPDNWIYIHDPDVRVGRVQNFKNWSPYMVPDENKTCLGLEYFCFEGDELWTMPDQELIELGKREMEILGLIRSSDVEDGAVVRIPKAYPVYDSAYLKSLQTVQQFLSRIDNLQLVGRNGMHRYNNQDHSMLTAMLAVRNIMGGKYDLWEVNADQEYHEEITDLEKKAGEKFAPLASPELLVSTRNLVQSFARMDKLAFATSIGTVCGLAIFLVTFMLTVKGGKVIGPNLQLLGQYFMGYSVTVKGAFIGMGYSFLWGFIWGWLFAYLRNFSIGLFIYRAKRKAELLSFGEFLDHF